MIDIKLVKQYLRIDSDQEDELLLHLMKAAQEAASEYMRIVFSDKISSDVMQGILFHIAYLYENRSGEGGAVIPEESLRLYQPYRQVRII